MSADSPLLQKSNFTTSEKVTEEKAYSVFEINAFIRQQLEVQVGTIWVRGELSNFKPHTSGHFYFSLKDSQAQISGVMFRGFNSKLKFKPHDGMEVLVRGRITVYEPRGSYQINCDMMEPVGAGALQKAFEQLKEKLKNEGLFLPERKRPLPPYPQHIAVVTSPTGAAIKDILNILQRRAPGIRVTIVPTLVQGEGASAQICSALIKAQQLSDVDVIICGRGGGSMEDLWCFNDEALAREIVKSKVPVISAVGHEIDFTIADFVADLRAPTPSAAAEQVAKSSVEIHARVTQLFRLLKISIEKSIKLQTQKLLHLHKSLIDPRKQLERFAQRNDEWYERLGIALKNLFTQKKMRIELLTQQMKKPTDLILAKKNKIDKNFIRINSLMQLKLERNQAFLNSSMHVLDSLSPLKVVDRGYSIVTEAKQKTLIKSYKQVNVNDELNIKLAEGELVAKIIEARKQ